MPEPEYRRRAEASRKAAWTAPTLDRRSDCFKDALICAILALNEPVEALKQRRRIDRWLVFGDSAQELETAAIYHAADIFGNESFRIVNDYVVLPVSERPGFGEEAGGKKYYARITVEVVE